MVAALPRRHRNVPRCGPERATKRRGRQDGRYNDWSGFGKGRVSTPRYVNDGPSEIPQETYAIAVSKVYGRPAAFVGGDGGLWQRSLLGAWDRAHRPKPCKLEGNAYLCRAISAKLTRKWSPQQIAGWLMREHPDDEDKRVSHETIYRSLFIQTRGVLKKELLAHLRATRSIRRSRHATLKRSGLGRFNDAVSIRDRPAEADDRAVPDHWPLGDASITCQLTGRRPDRRLRQQLHCYSRRAAHALRDAGQGEQQRQPKCHSGVDQTVTQVAERAVSLTDLGPRIGDGWAQEIHLGDGYRCLPVRATQSLAAWHKRKYKQTAATVLPKRNGFVDT